MPPQDGAPIGDTDLGPEEGETGLGQRLGENVSKLVVCGNMSNLERPSLNFLTNKVIVKSKMFYARVKY